MIAVTKDFTDIPTILGSQKAIDAIKLAIDEKLHHSFNSNIYKKGSIDKLKEIYYYKCAYCETNGESGYYAEVEHYRPKKGDINKDLHTGYYWLGYEWSNLILSCKKCNIKKSTKFPINGVRVENPILEINGLPTKESKEINSTIFYDEEPLLINPEIDKPEEHIIILPSGECKGITDRGNTTIAICNLNRESLIFGRKEPINEFFADAMEIFKEYQLSEITEEEFKRNLERHLKKIILNTRAQKQFSAFWRFLYIKFDLFCNTYLPKDEAKVLNKYFLEFTSTLK